MKPTNSSNSATYPRYSVQLQHQARLINAKYWLRILYPHTLSRETIFQTNFNFKMSDISILVSLSSLHTKRKVVEKLSNELSLWQLYGCHPKNCLGCHQGQPKSCHCDVITGTTLTTLKLSIGDNSLTIRWQLYDIPSFCVLGRFNLEHLPNYYRN